MWTMLPRIDIEDLLIWAYREEAVETNPCASPDACTVRWAVQALPVVNAAIVIHHARLGHPPEWRPGPGTIVSLDEARRARTLYREWVRTLLVLRVALDGALSHIAVLGPAAGDRPWRQARRSA
jgi:hypothetical protein